MVDSHLADRLLPHCRPGPVLDLLAGSATTVGPHALRAAPSDPIAGRLVRRGDVNQATRVVAAITSPQLLQQLVTSERRVAVLHALAANPHLPPAAVSVLADRAEERCDSELAKQLAAARPQAELAELLLERPVFRSLLEEGVRAMAWALRNAADERLLRRAADLPPSALAEVLFALTHFDTVGSPETLLALAVAAKLGDGGSINADVARAILAGDPPAGLQRRALGELGWLEVRKRLVRIVADGHSPLRLTDVLTGAPGAQMPALAGALTDAGAVVDTDVAELLDVPEMTRSSVEPLRTTPAATARLADSSNPQVAAVFLLRLPDAAARIPHAAPEVADALQPTAARLAELAEAGLPDEWVLRFARQLLDTHRWRSDSGPLRRRLLRLAPDEVAAQLQPGPSDLDLLLGRADAAALPATLRRILADPTLDVADRRRCAAVLPGDALVAWLNYGPGRERIAPGDVTWLLEHSADRDGLVAALAETAAGSDEPWMPEVVATVPLDWARMRSATALRVLLDALTEEFGQDMAAWNAAFALLPAWVGTPDQLVGTVRAVLDEEAN